MWLWHFWKPDIPSFQKMYVVQNLYCGNSNLFHLEDEIKRKKSLKMCQNCNFLHKISNKTIERGSFVQNISYILRANKIEYVCCFQVKKWAEKLKYRNFVQFCKIFRIFLITTIYVATALETSVNGPNGDQHISWLAWDFCFIFFLFNCILSQLSE